MLRREFGRGLGALAVCLALVSSVAWADDHGLKQGTPGLKTAGALAFGPSGILFVGDTQSAAIFAIATGETGSASPASISVDDVDGKLAGMMGVEPRDININDMAVNPDTGSVYFSVSRSGAPDAAPAIFRIKADGSITPLSLKNVPFAKAELPNAPAPGGTGRRDLRSQAITDLGFVDGKLFISGLSNEEFASTLRCIPFPFDDVNRGTGVEIYHGAHGKFETRSPVRTFTHYKIDGEPHLLAAYTCTPLVKFRISDLKPGEKFRGHTVAELGNMNRPLDMFVYNKDGADYVLIANNSRGVMKVPAGKIGGAGAIEAKVARGEAAGVAYETIKSLKGVEQLDRLNDTQAVILVVGDDNSKSLRTIDLP